MARRLLTVLVAVISLGVFAGCAGRGSTGSAGASSSSPPPAIAPVSPSAPEPSTSAGELTLSGQVEQGVEPGCLILRADGKSYELASNDALLKPGVSVQVTGIIQTGMMSHCQQGPILKVTSVRVH